MDSDRYGLTRRRILRVAAGAAGALAALGRTGTVGAARPTRGSQVVTLTFSPWWGNGAPWNATAVRLCQETLDTGFHAQHPGLRALVVPSVEGAAGTVIAETLAGSGFPDVFSDCCPDLPALQAAGVLMPLNAYLKQDNVDLSVWSPGRLAGLTFGGELIGLPAYDGPEVVAYRQDLLDEYGLPYPSPDWDYLEAERIWRAAARQVNGKTLYGASLDFTSRNLNAFLRGWGAAVYDATRTRCLLDQPAAVAAGEWLFRLVWDKVVAPVRMDVGGLRQDLALQNWGVAGAVFSVCGGWDIFGLATLLGDRVRWDLLPMPTWPKGFSTMVNNDFYAINRATRDPEAAWLLLKWAMVDGAWQRFTIRAILAPPALSFLWDEWEAVITAAAPTLRGKALHWYRDAALSPRVVPQSFFLYEGVQADTLLGQALTSIVNRQVGVAEGFTQVARQIDALEATGAAAQAAANAAATKVSEILVRTAPGPSAQYPAPTVTGVGLPPADGTPYVHVGPSGTYTLLGDGTDVYTTSNNCVFACLPVTASEGSWRCRVVAITNLSCRQGGKPALSPWLKVGLLAAGDLSDDPAFVSVHVTGANLIEWQGRPIPGVYPSGEAGLAPMANGKPATALLAPVSQPQANQLLAPLWLRLDRTGATWTAYGSLDGTHWTPLGAPMVVDVAGCWLGIFACAHNSSFGGTGYLRATFDQLGFTPVRFVQVGRSGTPPAAGPVPPNWWSVPGLLG
jgi:multiple sugar transport system substrate-binding protein